MTKQFSLAAFAIGIAVIAWMGSAFIGANPLALGVTLTIGALFCVGGLELRRFQSETRQLQLAMQREQQPVTDLDTWLARLPAGLDHSVRQRIQGQHAGLPAPVLTPYLTGLLVMLGLLGTFVGMVETLKGAVFALEGTSELEAIRAGLAAPIKGLGMAFGTSVAGVCASACLGLISTLSRRDRLAVSRLLDSKIRSVFQRYSLDHNRQQTFHAIQSQAEALPEVTRHLGELAQQLGGFSGEVGNHLIEAQQQFLQAAQTGYTALAQDVDRALQQSLRSSGEQAINNLQPMVEQILKSMGDEVRRTQQQLEQSVSQQLQALTRELKAEIAALREEETRRGEIAGQKLGELHGLAVEQLAKLGRELEQPLQRLLDSAGDNAEAIAQLLAKIQTEANRTAENDAGLLQERARLLQQLDQLQRALQETTSAQRSAVETLLQTSAETLANVEQHFANALRGELLNLTQTVDQLSASSAGLDSLGEAFADSVNRFDDSNQAMMACLNRVENGLQNSATRSDEQLAYYVAQAREIIDHNLHTQQEIIGQLRQLQRDRAVEA